MPKRNLRIVKRGPEGTLGVCESCNMQFKIPSDSIQAEPELKRKFDEHKCQPLDSSQNALRIVREATEGK